MTVWWCEEHQVSELLGEGEVSNPSKNPKTCAFYAEESCWEINRGIGGPVTEKPCRMVEMQLVPADARMVSAGVEAAVRLVVDVIDDLDDMIVNYPNEDLADQSDNVYQAARELRSQYAEANV